MTGYIGTLKNVISFNCIPLTFQIYKLQDYLISLLEFMISYQTRNLASFVNLCIIFL